jgi:tetratricopeptide (TPR) repeat protein
MNAIPRSLLWICPCIAAISFGFSASQAADFKDYNDALRQGSRLAREMKHAEAQEALEAALKLARDDKERLQAYQLLLSPYRALPEIDKMLAAQEFILLHAETKARRKNAASDVGSFLHQRGKIDAGIERYEAKFKADPLDVAALHILPVLYKQFRKDEALAQAIQVQADSLDRKLAKQLAEKHEAAAAAAPKLAAWNWKEAAVAWLEAEDNAQALAAAQKSAASAPEERSTILAYYWREALGDVLLKTGEPKEAVKHYEAAMLVAPSQLHRDGITKKLAEAKR